MGSDTAITVKPRIYVACLAAYNNGWLHGAWIDADQSEDDIREEIAAMLRRSPVPHAEDYAIHDHEGFGDMAVSESTGIGEVAQIAAFVIEHGDLGSAVAAYYGGDIEDAEEALSDNYHGCYASLADFVREMTEESISIPKPIEPYVDWQAMARDWELNGDVFTVETGFGEVHVFTSR